MKFKQAIEHIENSGCVFDIGQLEKDCLRELSKRVKRGTIVKIKSLWPWHTRGVRKTAYCLPGLKQHFENPCN